MKLSKILVTGANGFLGTHLLQFLNDLNLEVHTLGTEKPLIGTYHSIAFNEQSKLKDLIRDVKPDAIFHLAGVSSAHELSKYYEINVVFATNIIEGVKEWGNNNCPILLTGTSAEYGLIEKSDLPIKETTFPRPYNHYGISKLAQTLMGLREAQNGWPLIVVRPFNIIGPRMPDHLVIQSFIRQLIQINQKICPPILEVGNLSSLRDFVNVSDVVQAMWLLIQNPEAVGEVVNICSGVGTSIEKILSILLEVTQVKVEIRVDPNKVRSIETPVHFGSFEKLKNLTGFTPKSDIKSNMIQILKFEGLM